MKNPKEDGKFVVELSKQMWGAVEERKLFTQFMTRHLVGHHKKKKEEISPFALSN